MINKYAEIQDRLVLYNACKGILRVKVANFYKFAEDAPMAEPHPITIRSSTPDPGTKPEKSMLSGVGTGLATGTAAGLGGYTATDWLTKKLGLTADRGGWRKWLGRGIKTTGTVGSALAGYALGYGFENGARDSYNATRILPPKK